MEKDFVLLVQQANPFEMRAIVEQLPPQDTDAKKDDEKKQDEKEATKAKAKEMALQVLFFLSRVYVLCFLLFAFRVLLFRLCFVFCVFFFQAEDGIRDGIS